MPPDILEIFLFTLALPLKVTRRLQFHQKDKQQFNWGHVSLHCWMHIKIIIWLIRQKLNRKKCYVKCPRPRLCQIQLTRWYIIAHV